MEHTVETLLSHGGTPDELIAKIKRGEVSAGGGATTGSATIDADEELARQLAREDQQSQRLQGERFVPPGQRRVMASNVTAPSRLGSLPAASRVGSQSVGKKGRGTPTTLPVDFLRIPGRKYPQQQEAVGAGGGMTDEELARMLQDELFQEELRLVYV